MIDYGSFTQMALISQLVLLQLCVNSDWLTFSYTIIHYIGSNFVSFESRDGYEKYSFVKNISVNRP